MFRKTVYILFSLIFLLETSGVTLLQHLCSSADTRDITAINGIPQEEQGSCCCRLSDTCHETQGGQAPLALDVPPCCITVSTYLRFDFTSQVVVSHDLTPPHEFTVIDCGLNQAPVTTPFIVPADPYYRFHSPPLTGLSLLRAVHQLKIPVFFG